MHASQLAIGSVLQGRYKLGDAIASGGMGSVYQAEDLRLGIPVAVKLAASDSALHVRSLQSEARLLARLRHPGLPRVIDLFSELGQNFMVMEFLCGQSLGTLLYRHGAQPAATVLDWTDKLLNVLTYLHSQEPAVVHGDIKPENLFLTSRGEIVLLDFGTAVSSSEQAPPATNFAYTANYAPPEQLRGEQPDPRSEIFSTAATAYHLLTGICPADAQLRLQAASQRRAEPLRPAHEVSQNVSLDLSSLLEAALQLDSERRPHSVIELQKKLSILPRPAVLTPQPQPPQSPATATAPTIRESQPMPLPAPKSATVETPQRSQYEIKKLLGEGGMGQVFLAVDPKTHQTVCLKRLRPNVSQTALKQECEAIARLNHPNIVKLFDYELNSSEPYMVTEFVDGISLSAYIARHRPIAAPVAVEIGKKLLSALHHAHQCEVLHCDLKPDNILLIRNGADLVPKVLDFGLAIVERLDDQGHKTGVGRLAGTPIYMAPEQFRGTVLSPACDVYAIALIIAEMMTGEVPFQFDGRDIPAIAQTKFERPFAIGDLRTSVEGLPAPIARALREATAQDPQDRSTAIEFLRALSDAVPAVPSPQIWAPLTDCPGAPALEPPAGWFDSAGFVGGVSVDYEYATEFIEVSSRRQQVMRISSSARNTDEDFASLMQRCPVWHLCGSRLSLSGWLQAQGVSGSVSLWLRIDGPGGKTLIFDNMNSRGLHGTAPWTACDITIEVPRHAQWLSYGVLLSGRGTARATAITLRAGKPGNEKLLSLYESDDYKLPE